MKPKRNNWEIRNNSSNMAAILHPVNECYCTETRIPPKLFSHPKSYTGFCDSPQRPPYEIPQSYPTHNDTSYDDQQIAPVATEIPHLGDFRRKHYFETHSVEDLIRKIPSHTCVHQFGLDERFLAKPLNRDPYGGSKCVICGEGMKDTRRPSSGNSKSKMAAVGEVKKRASPEATIVDKEAMATGGETSLPKFYRYGLAPKNVFIGEADVQMFMKEKQMGEEWRTIEGKRPNYSDTYALKYQKGVR